MFYIIASTSKPLPSRDRLIAACEARNVPYEVLDPVLSDPASMSLSENDSFYRVSVTKRASHLDIYMTKMGCKSVRISDFVKLDAIERDLLCTQNNILTIPTVYFPVLKQDELEKQVTSIGGFPVVIKEMGSSNGRGVMKVDSMSSLLSILRTVISTAKGNVFLKKYVEHNEQARIVVLGDTVIGEQAHIKEGDEVILNTGVHALQNKEYSSDIREMAILATKTLGLRFAGVDILIGSDGKNYLAEVNMPCDFSYVEDATGVDIAGEIVEFLN